MSTSKKKLINMTYHHGDLANELKKNAFSMIKDKGVGQLTLRSLAARSGVSSTAVYRHYQSKEHLLAVLAEDSLQTLQDEMIKQEAHPKRLQKMGIAYVQFAMQYPVQFRLMLDPDIDKTKFPSLLKKYQQTYAIVRSEVERCIELGLMVGDIENLAFTSWATVHGTALLLLDKHLPIDHPSDGVKIALEITTIVGRGLSRMNTEK